MARCNDRLLCLLYRKSKKIQKATIIRIFTISENRKIESLKIFEISPIPREMKKVRFSPQKTYEAGRLICNSPGATDSKNNFCSTHKLEKVEGYQSVC